MKILYVVDDFSRSHGWGVYTHNLVKEALLNGHEVHVAVSHQNQLSFRKKEEVIQHPILLPPHKIMWHPLRIWVQWMRLKKIIKVIQPDLIHVTCEPYIQPFAFSNPGTPPVVYTLHGTYANLPLVVPQGIRRMICARIYTKAVCNVTSVISVSEATKKRFPAFLDMQGIRKTVHVIHNSIDMSQTVSKSNSPTHQCNILTVGEVKRRKGIHETIKIFSRWADSRKKKVVYNVAGSFVETTEYVRLVRGLIQEAESPFFSVVLHGSISEQRKSELLKEASLYVHLERVSPEYFEVEGFGISIIEAASYGIPALVAKGSATEEAVNDGISGLTVDLDDEDGVNEVIDRLLIHGVISNSGPIEWATQHSTKSIFKEVNEVYAKSIEK